VLAIAGPTHVFYDLDTPITISSLGTNQNVDYLRGDQIPQFDLYLSFTGGSILRDLQKRWGAKMARPLYGCVDPDVYRRTAPRADFECMLSYMGTYAADRQSQLDDLFLEPARRMSDSNFLLAGSLYPHGWVWPTNVRRFEHVAPSDHPSLYSSSTATLNITRAGMARTGYCPSGRFFEAAACGTPIISDYFEGLETFFTPEKEILIARSSGEVVRALTDGAGTLPLIGERARERTLEEHTGDRRAEQLLEYLEEARTPASICEAAEKAGVV
jgi:spore maturation protein CgeB